ncbi:YsnF/AvaK domain-containing protein [Kocuria sp. SM24M-10]|uniref:YsnF/AvaK domain-containing protein n=1 Tax=Kocuria sp. SM24M-10 TaxID=1660349 RepID=UPI000AA87E3E|nr:YsnF/AvaK domain-containing protein [Kocuria sp. SM24M-10]
MSTSDDRPYDQETAHTERPGTRPDRTRDVDDTGVERHAPSSSTELWDHNAYGREGRDVGGDPTSGTTDTRDPRGGAPAYNIDAGDDDAHRHGDDAGEDDGTNVRRTGESLTGADATAGRARESVADEHREPSGGAGDQAFDQESAARDDRPGGDRFEGDRFEGDRFGDAVPARGRSEGGRAEEDAATVVRHEERLRAGTERVESGRLRLRKYVVEEPVREEQTLASEDVEEIRTPITEEEREAFLAGQDLPVGEDEVILYREVPVVQTVRVPYQRVRLAVRRTERTEVIEETVRQERIDVQEQDGRA